MYPMHSPPGMTFIEVLLATSLLTLMLIGTVGWMSYATSIQQQTDWQTLVIEQLNGAAVLLHAFPDQTKNVLYEWKTRIQKIFPDHFIIRTESGGNEVRIQIEWPAPIGSIWRCQGQQSPKNSCLELEVSG